MHKGSEPTCFSATMLQHHSNMMRTATHAFGRHFFSTDNMVCGGAERVGALPLVRRPWIFRQQLAEAEARAPLVEEANSAGFVDDCTTTCERAPDVADTSCVQFPEQDWEPLEAATAQSYALAHPPSSPYEDFGSDSDEYCQPLGVSDLDLIEIESISAHDLGPVVEYHPHEPFQESDDAADDMAVDLDMPPAPEFDDDPDETRRLLHDVYQVEQLPISRIAARLNPLCFSRTLVGREAEREQIMNVLASCRDHVWGHSLYIFGSNGVGKTTTVKSVTDLLDPETTVVINVNCCRFTRSVDLFAETWRVFCSERTDQDICRFLNATHFRTQWRSVGASQARNRIQQMLKISARMARDSGTAPTRRFVLVLDEMDWLNTKRNASVLYQLLEWKTQYPLSVIMISNKPDFESPETQRGKIKSRQDANVLAFWPYTKERLVDILMSRLEWDREACDWVRENLISDMEFAVKFIAAWCSSTSGDARPALARLSALVSAAHQHWQAARTDKRSTQSSGGSIEFRPVGGYPLGQSDITLLYRLACVHVSPRLRMLQCCTPVAARVLLLLIMQQSETKRTLRAGAVFQGVSTIQLIRRYGELSDDYSVSLSGESVKRAIMELAGLQVVSFTAASNTLRTQVLGWMVECSLDADEVLICLQSRKGKLQPFYKTTYRYVFGHDDEDAAAAAGSGRS